MSLLIPTKNDYEDAHEGNPEEVENYHKEVAQLHGKTGEFRWKFEVVPGFFIQSSGSTDELSFNHATDNFGRIGSWEEITEKLVQLNKSAEDNEVYKLLFLARHGQGFHNQIVEKYGLPAWGSKWHALTNDGDIVYAPDPMLTEIGISQAKENNKAWKREIALGAPIPSKFYVSPLQRSCHTLAYTWDGIKPADTHPLVYEGVRETIGKNLCDKRSTRTVIAERFANEPTQFKIHESVTENDELFTTSHREDLVERTIRINRFLQYLFEQDIDAVSGKVDRARALDDTFVSVTSHGGTIKSFITAVGHREFTISTGGMIPIVVKAKRH